MTLWQSEQEPVEPRLGPMGWAIALTRLTAMAIIIYGLMIILAITRLLESPFRARPISPHIVQLACRASLIILGFKVRTHGDPMRHDGAIVCNHGSWFDIFTLNSASQVFFVSKAEVSKWPAIGIVARSTGTVFIERKASHAKRQKTQFAERLISGDRLLFFPEGTSTDGRRVVGFKSTLFAAFFDKELVESMWIQPASLIYHAPKGRDARFYGWWGDMEFLPHFLKTLGVARSGSADIIFHPPVRVTDFKDRKALASHCEKEARKGLEAMISSTQED
jgi:lyso-ornithine lipid O-acyltransferase